MGFIKKFAFGTFCSSSALMTYWYYYPREFYEKYKFINEIVNTKIKNPRPRPPTPY